MNSKTSDSKFAPRRPRSPVDKFLLEGREEGLGAALSCAEPLQPIDTAMLGSRAAYGSVLGTTTTVLSRLSGASSQVSGKPGPLHGNPADATRPADRPGSDATPVLMPLHHFCTRPEPTGRRRSPVTRALSRESAAASGGRGAPGSCQRDSRMA